MRPAFFVARRPFFFREFHASSVASCVDTAASVTFAHAGPGRRLQHRRTSTRFWRFQTMKSSKVQWVGLAVWGGSVAAGVVAGGGGGGDGAAPQGTMRFAMTDAPACGYD